jgi:anti-anti-sigma factor
MMTFERRIVGEIQVLTPRKNLVGGEETVALSEAIGGITHPMIVLDLHRINWLSSLGIEALRRLHRQCVEQRGWLRLACVGERIESVLLTMRLHWVFETFDSVDEALAAPQKRVANH